MEKILAHCLLHRKIGFRDGAYFFSTILVPTGVYWFFAVPESKTAYIASYLVCSFSAFSFFGVVFFQYSVNTANERTSSWAQWSKTLPCPMIIPLIARFLTSLVFGFLSCALIYLIALKYTPTDLSFVTYLKVFGLLAIGSIPFLMFGIFCGQIFSTKSIVPVANFIYLVLSFSGGLWKPPEILPQVLQDICPYLPTYHYGRLVWSIPAADQPFEMQNAMYLAGFTLFFFAALMIQENNLHKKLLGNFRSKKIA